MSSWSPWQENNMLSNSVWRRWITFRGRPNSQAAAFIRRWWVCLCYPDSNIHEANMGPTWVLSDPDGPHVDPMTLSVRVILQWCHRLVIQMSSMRISQCDESGYSTIYSTCIYIHGLVQEIHNSSALAMELHLFCTNLLICWLLMTAVFCILTYLSGT